MLKLVIILILFFHVFSSLDIDCFDVLTAAFPTMVPIALGSFGEHFDTVLQNYLAGTTYAWITIRLEHSSYPNLAVVFALYNRREKLVLTGLSKMSREWTAGRPGPFLLISQYASLFTTFAPPCF